MIERTPNLLKRSWRVATRDEKLAANYLTPITIACILEWI